MTLDQLTVSSNLVNLVGDIAWPTVAVIGIFAFIFSGTLRTWLVEVVQRIRKVSGFGVDIELSPSVASKVLEITSQAFDSLRQRVDVEIDRLLHVYDINDQRNRLVQDVVRPELEKYGTVPNFRTTIYVEDALFTETMYQLLDYFPKTPGRRGRTYPIRFGIVGRAWRSRRDQIEADVPTDTQKLITDWGMTWEQAATAGQDRRSFAAILIRDIRGRQVCLFYMDSPELSAFGDTQIRKDSLASAVKEGAKRLGMVDSVGSVMNELRSKTPLIPIYSGDD
jgi:hypothetical protein